MGSFVFKWEHPATDVYVTGTFDNWSKSEKLVKTGDIFEKNVDLKDASQKIYYKFVVDGNWVTDHTAPQENDHEGNLNNVLTTERIVKYTPATAGIMSSVAPTSTTAELAKDVPKETTTGSSEIPGTFPETPVNEPASFSVNPIPASAGLGNPITLAPGEKVPEPETLTSNTVASTVHDDLSLVPEPTFSVAPIPASAGLGNPISLAAGEKVPDPSTINANSVTSTVKLDKASYEASDSAPVLPPVVTPQVERDSKGTGVLDLPPIINNNLIPESSLPIGTSGIGTFDASPTIQSVGPNSTTAALAAAVPLEASKVPDVSKATIQSVGPDSTTAALAAAVPLEASKVPDISKATIQSVGPDSTTAALAAVVPLEASKVPDVVKESQIEAGFAPEASAVPEEVLEKSAVEKELLSEVHEAPATSDGTTHESPVEAVTGVTATEAAAAVGATALAIGGTAAAYAVIAKDKAAEIVESVSSTDPTTLIPESIPTSIASINAESSEATATPAVPAPTVPEPVKESIAEAGASPEAAAYTEPIVEKKIVEKELLSEIKPETSTGESAPSSTLSPGKTTTRVESRDVSPTTVPGTHTQSIPASEPSTTTQTAPVVTSGVESATAAAVTPATVPSTTAPVTTAPVTAAEDTPAPVTAAKDITSTPAAPAKANFAEASIPASSAAGSSAAVDAKKKKRNSFFGRLKAKFSDKEKDKA